MIRKEIMGVSFRSGNYFILSDKEGVSIGDYILWKDVKYKITDIQPYGLYYKYTVDKKLESLARKWQYVEIIKPSKFTTETERRRVNIPIPAETKIEKLYHRYEDFSREIPGIPGSKYEVYEIKTYPDGRREERKLREEEVIQPTPNVKQIGTKPIYTYDTKVEYEDIPIPEDVIKYSDAKPYGTPDDITPGSKGRLRKTVRYTYKKGIEDGKEVRDTFREVEPKPRIITKYNGSRLESTRTERVKVDVKAPIGINEIKVFEWYTDKIENIPAKDGYYYQEYTINTYTDGTRKWETNVLSKDHVDEVSAVQAIRKVGIKPIERFETAYEYEEIPIPFEPEMVLDNSIYANTPYKTIFHGKKGKITREYKNRYYKDQFKDRKLVNTTRIEAKPKKIRRGTKPYITRTETGRDKKVVPIPKAPRINKRYDQWEDYNVKVSDGKEGSYYEEWRIDYYSDGTNKKTVTNPKADFIDAKPVIFDKGTKRINWTKTREEVEEDTEVKIKIELDDNMYADEDDVILDNGSLGKTIHVITEYYKKDEKQSEKETSTRRVEGRPRRIKRGNKKGEYLWRRLRVEYIDGRIEYIDCKYIPDKEIQNELSVIRTEHESYREQTNKEIKEFVKKTDYDLNNNRLNEEINSISRTAEQTKESISNVQSGLKQEILKTASEYKRDIQNAKDGLSSQIRQSADEYSRKLTNTKEELSSEIEQSASRISLEVGGKITRGEARELFSTFELTTDQIRAVSNNITLSTLGGVSRDEAERIAESKKLSSYEIQREAERAFSSFELTPSQINAITRNFNVTADKISLEGYITNNRGFEVSRYGDVTMRDATIRSGTFEGDITGNSKIKIGQNGYLRQSGNGLVVAAPASPSSNRGVGFQLLGDRNGNAPKGFYLYATDDIARGGVEPMVNEELLTVNGRIKFAFKYRDSMVGYGKPVTSNYVKNSPITADSGMYAISFLGVNGEGELFLQDGTTSGKNSWWIRTDNSSSDKRLKKNIVDTRYRALDTIERINFKEFDWIKTDKRIPKKHTKIGIIADELQLINPELVYEDKSKEKIKYIDDFRLLNVTAKAVQELSQKNKELEERIEKLENILKEIQNEKNNTK